MRRLLNFETWKMLIATVFVSALLVAVIQGSHERSQALEANKAANERGLSSQQAASKRISELQAKIDALSSEVQVAAANRATEDASIKVLSEQVQRLGGKPIVLATTTTIPTKLSTTTTQPPPPPTTAKPAVTAPPPTAKPNLATTTTTRAITTTTRR